MFQDMDNEKNLLELLEQKVDRLIEALHRIKEEKKDLEGNIREKEEKILELEKRVRLLENDRKEASTRVERMLSKLEAIIAPEQDGRI